MSNLNNVQVYIMALNSLTDILSREHMVNPPYCMSLTTLAIRSSWAHYFSKDLGRLKPWIISQPAVFRVITGRGCGNDVVHLLRDPHERKNNEEVEEENEEEESFPTATSLPSDEDDLHRPFDASDSFFHDQARFETIGNAMEWMWKDDFSPDCIESELFNVEPAEARRIYEAAYCKCVRLTIRISNVVFDRSTSNMVLRELFRSQVRLSGNPQARLFFYKDDVNRGQIYCETAATLWSPGHSGPQTLAALVRVVDALDEGQMQVNGRVLELFQVGARPLKPAVAQSIGELLWLERRAATPPSPLPVAVAVTSTPPLPVAQAVAVTAAQPPSVAVLSVYVVTPPPLPAVAALWPAEFSYTALYDPVVNPSTNLDLIAALASMRAKEPLLVEKCRQRRLLPAGDREGYACKDGVEWIGFDDDSDDVDAKDTGNPADDKEFFSLGSGAEAEIYYGLYSNPSLPADGPKQLVAVKQKHHRKNMFNSKEQEYYEYISSLGGLPGIVRFHCGFTLKSMTTKHIVLVQDVALMSLRQLISGDIDRVDSIKEAAAAANGTVATAVAVGAGCLTPEDRFKLTKAACMAVAVFHPREIVHRDLRPDNFLIMPNGTLCITDFGLARKKPKKPVVGLSTHKKFTMMAITTMQPYEVQVEFKKNTVTELQRLEVDPSADVFMLGCVLAFIHLGFDPFDDDSILARAAPNLGTELGHSSPWLHHLLTWMLQHDKTKRPRIELVLRHPYFASREQNFGDNLINRIERVIINDYNPTQPNKGPVDTPAFRCVEQLLVHIEGMCAGAEVKWHETLPVDLLSGQSRLPFSAAPIVFRQNSSNTADTAAAAAVALLRAYPCPETAQLVKWLRNLYTHFSADPTQQDRMRRSKVSSATAGASSDHYATAGAFFYLHPAVSWLLPTLWERLVELTDEVEARRREMNRRHGLEKENMERDEADIATLLA